MIPFLQSHSGLTSRVSSIFANNEPGVWFDPSDLSTLYQDAAGTVPVTGVEQPVGLMLDKSKGLVLGPELVANGTFDTDVSGWTAENNASIAWENGELAVFTTTASSSGARQSLTTVAGRSYRISYASRSPNGLVRRLIVQSPYSVLDVNTSNAESSYIFVAGAASTTIIFASATNSPGSRLYDNISVRELPGNHAFQTTTTSRPVLRQDGNGTHYLYFDGVDDFLVTPTITPGIDKVQAFAGVRKLRDGSSGVIAELSAAFAINAGSLLFRCGDTTSDTGQYMFGSRGGAGFNTNQLAITGPFVSPITNTLTGLGNISGDSAILRVNGTQAAISTSDQGAGNYLAYPLYIGRRGGGSLPFGGHLYSLIVRFGSNLPIETIENTEKYINGLTKAY